MEMTVRAATEADAVSLADRLRAADLKEIECQGGNAADVLLSGIRSPDPTYVAVDEDDIPHIIFGMAPSHTPVLGFVWMMATPAIRRCWVRLLRETPQWVDTLAEPYEALSNVVHAENEVHIRWLKWAGFVFLRKVTVLGEDFYEFARLTKRD